jgi:hypothetical protein
MAAAPRKTAATKPDAKNYLQKGSTKEEVMLYS